GYTWSISSGQLPSGFSLTASSGQIAGTPLVSGQFNFTVQVADSSSPANMASAALSITVSTASSSSLDQYGGRTDIKCTSSAGGFHTEKVNGRWWLCTPPGNAFFFQ